MAAAAFAAS